MFEAFTKGASIYYLCHFEWFCGKTKMQIGVANEYKQTENLQKTGASLSYEYRLVTGRNRKNQWRTKQARETFI